MFGSYQRALKAVLVHEGGYSNHPKDPGGATMKGVIQRVYDGYRRRMGQPVRSVRLIEDDELQAIYRTQYWDAIRGDELPAGVDYVIFDGAVNSGPVQSAKWLQRALGTVKVDGDIGETTLEACRAHRDHDALIAAICSRRMSFLRALKTWSTFGDGWSGRVAGVKRLGQAWAAGSVGPAPVFVPGAQAKAVITDAAPTIPKSPADTAIGGGIATTGIGSALNQAKDALSPLAGDGGWIGHVVAALVIAGAVLTIGGIAWRWYASRRAKAQADALDLPVTA